jgi:hypothetical protein
MLYLSGRCTYNYTGTAYNHVDSASYLYNGVNHRRMFTPEDWSYDTSVVYDMGLSPAIEDMRYLRTYDANFNKTSELVQRYYPGTGQFRNERKDIYTYDANANVTMHEYEEAQFGTGTLEKQYRQTIQYNTANKRTQNLWDMWEPVGGAYEPWQRVTYTYDANGHLQEELHEIAAGMGWNNSLRMTYTGTAPGDTTVLIEAWVSGNWQNSQRVMNSYDGAGNLISSEREMWNTMAFEPQSAEYYTYTSGRLQYMDNFYWNGSSYAPTDRYTYTYIMSDKLNFITEKSWNGSAYVLTAGNDSTQFHYETAGNVGNSPSAAAQVHVYPSPANSYITIQSGKAMQHCTATLCDMSGRVVKLFADANGNMARMDVQDVPAGNYILSVNGNITAREKIVIAR